MQFTEFIYDIGASIFTMFILAALSCPATWFTWNYVLVPLLNHAISPMDLFTAAMLNFGWNLFFFFKLQKRDILIAHHENEEVEDE